MTGAETHAPDEDLMVIAPAGDAAEASRAGAGSVELLEEDDSGDGCESSDAEREIEELGLDSKMGGTQRFVIWLVAALIVIGAAYVCWYWFFR